MKYKKFKNLPEGVDRVKVKIKKWDKMVRWYGVHSDGDIDLPNTYYFSRELKHLCGNVIELVYNDFITEWETLEDDWAISSSMVKWIKPVSGIFEDGTVIVDPEFEELMGHTDATGMRYWVLSYDKTLETHLVNIEKKDGVILRDVNQDTVVFDIYGHFL